jgi:hypothetical protein
MTRDGSLRLPLQHGRPTIQLKSKSSRQRAKNRLAVIFICNKGLDLKHEYHEGPKTGESFEKLARAVFQKPKIAVPNKQSKEKPKRHKSSGKDKV